MSYSYSSAGGEDKTTTSPEKGREGQGGWAAVSRGWVAVGGKRVADVWRPSSHASGEVRLGRKVDRRWKGRKCG